MKPMATREKLRSPDKDVQVTMSCGRIGEYRYVQVCVGVCRCVQVCAGVLTCTDTFGGQRMTTGFLFSVPLHLIF